VADPERFRSELPAIGNHPYFQTVTVTRDIDVQLAARLADVALDDFKALNPSINRPVILAAGTPEILLPWDNATIFERNFEAHNAGQFASWTVWSAPSTMSVSEAARRVGMTEADLRSANTIPPRMLIKAGSVLIVPRTPKTQNDVSVHVADNGQLNLAPEPRRITVKAGKNETVAGIARRYKLNPKQVADWNGVGTSAAFNTGQQVVLILPGKSTTRSSRGPKAKSAAGKRKQAKKAAKPVTQRR
jgi:membrane-bound lytic murein transglycosylase D